MGSHQPIRKVVTPEIPDKLYFRIGDVATLCDLPAYVLRFWETEFPQLKPNKGGTGQRLYRKRDVEMALRIKSLLYDQGYTIPGARQILKTEPRGAGEAAPVEVEPAKPISQTHRDTQLQSLRNEMIALLGMLQSPVSTTEPAKPQGKLKTMRPRLVVESNSEPKPGPAVIPHKLRLEQPNLFGDEPPAE